MSESATPFQIGAILSNRYRIDDRLGEGGMGTVWKAWDLNSERAVVIKVPQLSLLQEYGFRERFQKEIRALIDLTHPNIVTIHDVGEKDGLPFAVLQYLAGKSLEDYHLPALEKIDYHRVLEWTRQIAKALDFVHKKGMIHRDIKPGNILFDEDRNAYLADFGIAKVLSASPSFRNTQQITQSGMIVGTLHYMAPECFAEEVYSGFADQYSLAVTIYEFLSGQRPFKGTAPLEIARQKSDGDFHELSSLIRSIPGQINHAVTKAMSPEPSARYPSCTSFCEAMLSTMMGGVATNTHAPNDVASNHVASNNMAKQHGGWTSSPQPPPLPNQIQPGSSPGDGRPTAPLKSATTDTQPATPSDQVPTPAIPGQPVSNIKPNSLGDSGATPIPATLVPSSSHAKPNDSNPSSPGTPPGVGSSSPLGPTQSLPIAPTANVTPSHPPAQPNGLHNPLVGQPVSPQPTNQGASSDEPRSAVPIEASQVPGAMADEHVPTIVEANLANGVRSPTPNSGMPPAQQAATRKSDSSRIRRQSPKVKLKGTKTVIYYRCPWCWGEFEPEEILWIAEHPELVGDARIPNGKHRFLAERYSAHGDAYDIEGWRCKKNACPKCHLAIPRDYFDLKPLSFSLLGAPSSGKTCYLTSLAWRLRTILPSKFLMSFSDSDPELNASLIENETTHFMNSTGGLVRGKKTQLEGEEFGYYKVNYAGETVEYLRPYMFSMRPRTQHMNHGEARQISYALSCYDNAGEHFRPGAERMQKPVTQHLAEANAYLFVFDPSQHANFRSRVAKHSKDPQFLDSGASANPQQIILIEAQKRIREKLSLSVHEQNDRPLMVLVNKYDAWSEAIGGAVLTEPWIQTDPHRAAVLDMRTIERKSDQLKQLMLTLAPEFVHAAEEFSSNVLFIPTSSFGRTVETASTESGSKVGVMANQLAPMWVEVPILYLLASICKGVIRSK